MFEEMVGWAVEGGADMIIGETFYYAGEALAALEVAKSTGLPVVLTIAPMALNEMADGVGIVETCQRLEQGGADVVGMNCFRGPADHVAVAAPDPGRRFAATSVPCRFRIGRPPPSRRSST